MQDLSILNLTPLELNYRWDIRGVHASEFDMTPLHGVLPLNGTVHLTYLLHRRERLLLKRKCFGY